MKHIHWPKIGAGSLGQVEQGLFDLLKVTFLGNKGNLGFNIEEYFNNYLRSFSEAAYQTNFITKSKKRGLSSKKDN